MAGKSGGRTGAKCDKEDVEKEERQKTQRKILQTDVRVFFRGGLKESLALELKNV